MWPQVPANPGKLTDAELDAVQEELAADFDVGYSIKDQIVPRALEWCVGGAGGAGGLQRPQFKCAAV